MNFNIDKKEVKNLACELCEDNDYQPADLRILTEKLYELIV